MCSVGLGSRGLRYQLFFHVRICLGFTFRGFGLWGACVSYSEAWGFNTQKLAVLWVRASRSKVLRFESLGFVTCRKASLLSGLEVQRL